MSEQSSQPNWKPRFADRMAGMQASEIRELLKVIERPGIVSFAGGIPDPGLFPNDTIREAYGAILSNDKEAGRALQYSVSEGDPELREWIVGHMKRKGVACDASNILITNGSQQGLEFIGKLFLGRGNTALVTAPTYLGALQAFAPNEPRYDDLVRSGSNRTAASYKETAEAAGSDIGFAYVVPDFANPTGETLDRNKRLELLSLAGELDIPIIEDSPYSTLRYDGMHQPTIQSLDIEAQGGVDSSRVIYCGSFSKIFTPGLRVGWVCAAKPVINALVLIKQASDLNTPAVNQKVMLYLAERVFDEQVEKTCKSYRKKRDLMLARLPDVLPQGSSWSEPEGGMFIWVSLPEHYDTADLLKTAVEEHGIAYVPGHAFYADGDGRNTMRLSFSLPTEEQIKTGMDRLAALFA